jgi:RNA polymerase sigma-70 factor (ECF subfamily)
MGWPVARVARTLGINAGQVYLAKHRVARLVQKEIKSLSRNLI